METLDTLRKERDDAREACVGLIIRAIVGAYEIHDAIGILGGMTLLNACPYKAQLERALIGASVGNFVFACAVLGSAKKEEEGEVLFEAAA